MDVFYLLLAVHWLDRWFVLPFCPQQHWSGDEEAIEDPNIIFIRLHRRSSQPYQTFIYVTVFQRRQGTASMWSSRSDSMLTSPLCHFGSAALHWQTCGKHAGTYKKPTRGRIIAAEIRISCFCCNAKIWFLGTQPVQRCGETCSFSLISHELLWQYYR